MKKSIWVIDDDDIYQLIIKKLIRKSEVFGEQSYYRNAKNVIADLEKSELILPDIILLDINMPQMDGWQFITRLSAIFSDLKQRTKIYIVSSSIAYSDKDRAENFPEITAFLSKPLTIKLLKEISDCN